MRPRRNYSVEQKLQILHEAEQEGLTVILCKYDLSHSPYYRWKHKFDHNGSQGLKPLYHRIDQQDAVLMLSAVLDTYPAEVITLRNDNGSQFITTAVRTFLKEWGVFQEFSHVSTPEDNAYIEAFHSLLEREVIVRHKFDFFHNAERTLSNYYRFYNEKRLHSALNCKTPIQIWNQFFQRTKQSKSPKPN